MKRIIFLLGLFASALTGFAQAPLGCPTCTTEVKGILKADSLFLLPLRNDTLVNPGRPGALVNAYGQTWLYTGTQWAKLTGVAWGSIPGNITAQTDLMALLNAKQNQISNGYGWKLTGAVGSIDTAVLRKVDSVWKLNDSTIQYTINGRPPTSIVIKGSAVGTIVTAISFSAPSGIFNTPVTLANSSGSWTGTLSLITQGANTIFAGPATGSAAAPGFRPLVTADLPTSIPNSNLANNFIGFGIDNTGSAPGWSSTSPPLGSATVLHLPVVGPSTTGIVNPPLFAYWNAKIDSTTMSNDSVYEWRNGIRYSRYMIAAGSGLLSLNGQTGSTQSFQNGTAGTAPNISSAGNVHTFNNPLVNGADTGIVTPGLYNTWNAKEPAIAAPNTTNRYWNGYKNFVPLNTDSIAQGTSNKFFVTGDTAGLSGKEPGITAPNTTNKYWNGYKQFVPLNTDSIAQGTTNKFFVTGDTAGLSAKMTNFGGAPGQLEGTFAGIPAATLYATGTTYIAQDSGFQYVDTGSGGSRGWKKISGGSGGSGGSGSVNTFRAN
ncbi:MAG TPA: hypothetical protein VKQ52_19520 [Puia sp.]|nr:hypothetical protein [Puia sp.]